MAPQSPLTRLTLAPASVAEDLGFVALKDISRIRINDEPLDFRLIGGLMVSLHVQRWQLGRDLYRETQDADVGVLPITVKETDLLEQIRNLGYDRIEGNRFTKGVPDLPAVEATGKQPTAVIDILVPAFTSRARDNVQVGDELVTTEVLGLAQAFQQGPVVVDVEVVRMNGDAFVMQVPLPDEASSLVLKAFAWEVRSEDKDAIDLWRMLEVNAVAGVSPESFESGFGPRAVKIIREAFSDPTSPGTRLMAQGLGISSNESSRRHTRIQALVQRVFG
jgi:hypothetical protein